MDFHILGPLEVRAGGRVVPVPGRKQRALLALLLLARGEAVSSDRLIDELWPDADPAGARKALQVRVSQLRKTLGGEAVVTCPPGYAVPAGSLDLDRFEALCAEGRAAADPAALSAKLAEALALWRGEPLADLAFEPFAQAAAPQLEEARLAATEDRIAADLELGRHGELIAELDGLIGRHPLRERLRAQRMLALYRAGRQADALAEYRDARATLVGELGIEPGRELRELERRILEQDPALDLPAPIEPGGPLFVGRERELALLSDGLGAATRGDGRLFLLGGEPGAGKTRLADELARAAAARECRVLFGRCWEAGGAPAFWPWVQSLRSWVADADAGEAADVVGAGAADVAQLLPELRELLGDLPAPVDPESEGARFRLFDAVADVVRRLAAERPLVLVLDDLHAADVSSLLLLELLATRLQGARVLAIGAYRSTEVAAGGAMARMLAELTREPAVTRIELAGLSEDEVAEYLRARAGDDPPPSLAAALHHATDGNPLFVTELARLFTEEGVLAGEGAERLPIPAGVRDVIERRLERLGARCRELLALASVLGRDVELRVLARTAGSEPEEVLADLEEARAAAIVAGAARLRFSHALVRDVLYDGLPAAERARLHRAAASALLELHEADPDPVLAEIAHHQLEGAVGDGQLEAAESARRAGRRAARVHAYEEAARLFGRALEALDAGGAGAEDRCETLLELGDAHARSGHADEAKRVFLDAAAIARERGDVERLARAALGYGGRLVWLRSYGDMTLIEILEEALETLPGEHPARVGLLARLSGALRDQPGREADRHRLSAEGVALARRLGDPAALAHALDGRYPAIWSPANAEERRELSREWIEVAQRAKDRERLHHAYIGLAIAHLELGEMGPARDALGEMVRLAEELRQPGQSWITIEGEALFAVAAGQLEEAERLIELSYEYGRLGVPGEAPFARAIQIASVRRLQGRADEAIEEIESVRPRYRARLIAPALLTALLSDTGRHAEARRLLAEVAAGGFEGIAFDNEWLASMCLLAEAAAAVEERERAAELYELILPFGNVNALDYPEVYFGSASRALGVLATALGRFEEAERHLADAVAMDARTGSVLALAAGEAAQARLGAAVG